MFITSESEEKHAGLLNNELRHYQYATIKRPDLPLTLQLGRLKQKLRDQLRRLDTRRTCDGNVPDGSDCDGLNQ